MGWRQETRVNDLDPSSELEVTCKQCGKYRYEWPVELVIRDRIGHLFIDELQATLTCHDRRCSGAVRISQVHDHLNEGFVGGMP